MSLDFLSACVLLKLQHSDVLWRHVQSTVLDYLTVTVLIFICVGRSDMNRELCGRWDFEIMKGNRAFEARNIIIKTTHSQLRSTVSFHFATIHARLSLPLASFSTPVYPCFVFFKHVFQVIFYLSVNTFILYTSYLLILIFHFNPGAGFFMFVGHF